MAYENYQGNAGLGIGTGTGVGGNPGDFAVADRAIEGAFAQNKSAQDQSLSVLADTEKNIAAADQAYNVKMFQQKVADRDAMFKAFLDGSAKVDDFVDQDNPALKSARKQYDDAYSKWAENINDRDAAKNFKKAKDLQDDIAARLATRFTQKKIQEEAIKGMNPGADKDAAQAELDKWLNAKDKDGKPAMPTIHQKFSEFDPEKFNSQAVITTTPVKKGLFSYDINSFDYNKTFAAVSETNASGEGANKSNQFLYAYWDTKPKDQEFILEQSRKATEAYNLEHNLTGANAIQPIQAKIVGKNPDGSNIYRMVDDPNTFATKYLLLKNPTSSSKETFNKEEAAFAVGWKNANANMYRAVMQGKKIMAGIAKDENQSKALKTIYTDNVLAQPKLLQTAPGGGLLGFTNLPADASTPMLTTGKDGKVALVKPYGATPIYDNKTTDDNGNPSNLIGWKGGYYKPQYIYNGTEITADQIKSMYEKKIGVMEREGYPLEDFIRDGVVAGMDKKSGFQVNYMGEDGKISIDMFESTLNLLGNKNSGTGEQNPFSEE